MTAPGPGVRHAALMLLLIVTTACASARRPVPAVNAPDPGAPRVPATQPVPRDAEPARLPDAPGTPAVLHVVEGEATYYADKFHGRRTASGEIFRQDRLTAAHRTFPFGTIVRVTNLRNDRSVTVRITDRGPFGERAEERNRIIDLSRRAAELLGFVRAGWTPVRVEVLSWGKG